MNLKLFDIIFRLIYQTVKPNTIIILEDLSLQGFSIIEKPSEDYEVSKMIAQRLAKFHAASFFLADKVNMLKTRGCYRSLFQGSGDNYLK